MYMHIKGLAKLPKIVFFEVKLNHYVFLVCFSMFLQFLHQPSKKHKGFNMVLHPSTVHLHLWSTIYSIITPFVTDQLMQSWSTLLRGCHHPPLHFMQSTRRSKGLLSKDESLSLPRSDWNCYRNCYRLHVVNRRFKEPLSKDGSLSLHRFLPC